MLRRPSVQDDEADSSQQHSPPAASAGASGVRVLYEQHVAAIYRFIYAKVGNREEAEDLTSQVFLKAFRGSDAGARAQRILDRLPTRYRDVLTYRFLLNYSVRETAEQMRLSEANVKVLQFRALKRAAGEVAAMAGSG